MASPEEEDVSPEESAIFGDEEVPIHLDKGHPMRLPVATWSKMTKKQKDDYLKYVSGYLQALEDEQRSEWRKKNGF